MASRHIRWQHNETGSTTSEYCWNPWDSAFLAVMSMFNITKAADTTINQSRRVGETSINVTSILSYNFLQTPNIYESRSNRHPPKSSSAKTKRHASVMHPKMYKMQRLPFLRPCKQKCIEPIPTLTSGYCNPILYLH
jgi:hypothetical protein